MSNYWTRRKFLAATLGAATGAMLPLGQGCAVTPSKAARKTNFVVDFERVVARISPQSLGVCCTTYGRNALQNAEQAAAEEQLDFRYVRIPVGVREDRVTSSATGGPRDLDVPGLVKWYQKRGALVIAVLGGRTNDVDIAPGDAGRIAREFAEAGVDLDGVHFSSPNEPNNRKLDLEQTLVLSRQCSEEIRRVKPNLKLWGPVWSWYHRESLQKWAAAMDERCGGISFHHYAMGVSFLPTAQAMAQTPDWGREIREVRADLRALGLPEHVSITELNFSWRFEDGTPPQGKNERFFSAVNSVWAASTLGHVLSGGGSAAIYGNQNGALGVFVEAGPHDRGRPASSPMPIYWGLAAWTGAKRFSHFKDKMFHVETAAPGAMELFAANNEANGFNLVAINKSESLSQEVSTQLRHIRASSYEIWQTNPAAPFSAPKRLRQNVSLGKELNFTAPAMTVTTIVSKNR